MVKMPTRCAHYDNVCISSFKTVGNGITPQDDGFIYWHIDEDSFTPDLPKHKTVLALAECFNAWNPHLMPIQIKSTSDRKKAAIRVFFRVNGDKDLPSIFEEDVLAYAFFPRGKSLGYHADMYFNDEVNWLEVHKPEGASLFKVAVHEVGHALGIDHSRVKSDIMYPTYQPNDEVNFTHDTLSAIYSLYGREMAKIIDRETTERLEESNVALAVIVALVATALLCLFVFAGYSFATGRSLEAKYGEAQDA